MGSFSIGLRGESNYQSAISAAQIGEIAHLIEEPDNAYDSRAVQVLNAAGDLMGYLPRDSWLTNMLIDEGQRPVATIKGIARSEGSRHWGVVLQIDK